MLQTNGLTLQFGKDILFEDVTIKFISGNCYGVIGANGAGKSTFLKLLSGQIEASRGSVTKPHDKRLSFLKQDHFAYDQYTVLDTVIMGNQKLYDIMQEKAAIYAKVDFSEADGIKVGDLESIFDDMNGWDAESNAATLLTSLGIEVHLHNEYMKNLTGNLKVKVLLAQALFDNPDILLLDEPTNHLDRATMLWLEEFLITFENTIIVVSHDRYFLNKICTHIADIDYNQVTLYAGNYDFWYESSQLMLKQVKEQNKKKEEKIKELQEFIARFSANASKSKQATSRKKSLEKIELTEIKPSTRRYPYINFKFEKKLGTKVLVVDGISKTVDGVKLLDNVSFIVGPNDKINFVAENEKSISTLFDIITGKIQADAGTFIWGDTVQKGYFEKDHGHFFEKNISLIDFLTTMSVNKEVSFVRSFLGRMLFSGEDGHKLLPVLSGGERVRMLLASMMILNNNLLILDEPTNHLDMETITSLNKGLMDFEGVILFSSGDHQLTQTTANRIISINSVGNITDEFISYDQFIQRNI